MAATAHIADVVGAMRDRIATLSSIFGTMSVEIGNPAQFHPFSGGNPLVTIFVYRISPDNAAIVTAPNTAMAVRIHTLVTVYCEKAQAQGEAAGSRELRIVSHIARLFHEEPKLGPVKIREAVPIGALMSLVTQDLYVEAQLKAPDMEEINHIWTTQGDAPYRTSLVYELVFAYVTPSRPSDEGPPILRTVIGYRDQPADPYTPGVAPYLVEDASTAKPPQAVIAFNIGTIAAPVLAPARTVTLTAGPGTITSRLVAVAETVETLELTLERFDTATLAWVAEPITAPAGPVTLTTQSREALASGAALTQQSVGFAKPAAPGTYRFVAAKQGAPDALSVNQITLSVEAP